MEQRAQLAGGDPSTDLGLTGGDRVWGCSPASPHSPRKFLEPSMGVSALCPHVRASRGRDLPASGPRGRVPRPLLDSPQGVVGPPGIRNDQLRGLLIVLVVLRTQAGVPELQLSVEHGPRLRFHGPTVPTPALLPAGLPAESWPHLRLAGGRWRLPWGRVVWNLEQVWAGHRAREAACETAPSGHRPWGSQGWGA